MDIIPSNVPVPDPSLLTTDQLRQAVAALKELLVTRIEGVEKANNVFTENISRVPTLLDREVSKVNQSTGLQFASVDRQIGEVKALFAERFAGINTQIRDRDARSAEDKATQKSTNDKTDTNTAKQVENIVELMASDRRATDEKIASIISRLDRNDGTAASRAASSASTVTITTIGIGFVTLILLAAGAFATFHASQPASGVTVNQPAAQGLLGDRK